MQASSDGHSLSEVQPGGGKAGTTGRHWPFSLGAQFSGQMHINVRTGVELMTLQTVDIHSYDYLCDFIASL